MSIISGIFPELDHVKVRLTKQQRQILSCIDPMTVTDRWGDTRRIDSETYYTEAPVVPSAASPRADYGVEVISESREFMSVRMGGYLPKTGERDYQYHPVIFAVVHKRTDGVLYVCASGGRSGWRQVRRRVQEVYQALAKSARATRANKTRRQSRGAGEEEPVTHSLKEFPPNSARREAAFYVVCRTPTEALALCHVFSQAGLTTTIVEACKVLAWVNES